MITLEQLLEQVPERKRDLRTVEVDLTDLLGQGWIFVFREPTLTDLCAAADTQVHAEWRRAVPEIPHDLATVLELIARLHLAPPAESMGSGMFYAKLLQRLEPRVAVQVIRRISDALATAFGLDQFESSVEVKKKPSHRAKER